MTEDAYDSDDAQPAEDIDSLAVSSTYKVLGEFTDDTGAGVLGKNNAGSGTPIGVEGAVPKSSKGYGLATPDDVSIEGAIDSRATNFVVDASNESRLVGRSIVMGWRGNEVKSGAQAVAILGGGSQPANNVAYDFGAVISGGAGNKAGKDDGKTLSAQEPTVGGGRDNHAKGEQSTIAGGKDNESAGKHASVGGGFGNRAKGIGTTVGGGGDAAKTMPRNVAHDDFGTVAGGDGNQAGISGSMSATYATVGGGKNNTAIGSFSTVGGGKSNGAQQDGATVGGGVDNKAGRIHATVGGGSRNEVTAQRGTISGGASNSVQAVKGTVGGGGRNVAADKAATVGGGAQNEATGTHATVGGGDNNDAFGTQSTIGGGRGNFAAADGTTVAGGEQNTADDRWTTIGGGEGNTATSGTHGTVAGGTSNAVKAQYGTVAGGIRNTASGPKASVGGGTDNIASDEQATVGGGDFNAATGPDATVGGGTDNTASGKRATVPGGGSGIAADDDAFVWNDDTSYHDTDAFSGADGLSSSKAVNGEPVTGANTFSVSATGGVRFITGGSSVTYISGGSTGWSSASSRTVKTNVSPFDPEAALEGVTDMAVCTWEYEADDGDGAGVTHVGPMAEDFHGAFDADLGDSDAHINSINARGIAYAAIQGLAQRLDDARERLAAKDDRIEEQADRIDDLEAETDRIDEIERENERLRDRLDAVEDCL